MPMIDVEIARIWANERWPSPVVRRCVDGLLANCPRVEEAAPVYCRECEYSRPLPKDLERYGGHVLLCIRDPHNPLRSVWADSTCDDAVEGFSKNVGYTTVETDGDVLKVWAKEEGT